MVSLIVVGAFVLILLVLLKARYFQHRIYTVLIVLMLLFFYVSGAKVLDDNDVDFKSFNGMVTAGKLYTGWLGKAYENSKEVVGNVIKMDWNGDS